MWLRFRPDVRERSARRGGRVWAGCAATLLALSLLLNGISASVAYASTSPVLVRTVATAPSSPPEWATVPPIPPVWSAVGSPYVVDPAKATQLLDSFWQLRATALLWGEPEVLDQIESGTALEADEASCGCGVTPWGPPLAESVFVTKQTTFPAYFMAEAFTEIPGNATDGKTVVVLVFQRLTATTSWKVVIDSQQQVFTAKPPGQDIDQPVTDPEGFDVSTAVNFPGGVGNLAAKLAAYWEYWAVHRKAPASSVFWPGYWTTQRGPVIAADEGSVDPVTGTITHLNYLGEASNSAWVVPERGYAIACGSFKETVTFTAKKGYVQQGSARDQFPAALAPGEYAMVVETRLLSPCFYADPSGKALVFGAAPWLVGVVGYGRVQ